VTALPSHPPLPPPVRLAATDDEDAGAAHCRELAERLSPAEQELWVDRGYPVDDALARAWARHARFTAGDDTAQMARARAVYAAKLERRRARDRVRWALKPRR